MLSKRYESTEVDRRTWIHVPAGTLCSTEHILHNSLNVCPFDYTAVAVSWKVELS